nr:integrase, catalytic region, zinc finger, CCHC-type, peptidase aspartic, catalytic [Tanacetum cinerariifolium]
MYVNHDKYVVKSVKSVKQPPVKKVWQIKQVKQVWQETGKLFATVGHTDRPLVFRLRLFKTYDEGSLTAQEFRKKFIGTVRFENDHFDTIMGYGDYVIGDSVISRVYYVEGLGHSLFSVGQFYDSDLEVTFRKHSCYVQDTYGVELIKGHTDRPLVFELRLFKTYDEGSLTAQEFRKKLIGTVRFENDHFDTIMGYEDYVIGDSVISRVYYVEGLGHSLFSVGQFFDSDLEVTFRKHSCYVQDTDGVELIKAILSGVDNRPPMLEKDMYDLWKSRMKLDLHTTNVDQLHAYLGPHEYHANEVRLMHERNSDPLALVANHQMTKSPYQTHQQSYQHTQFQPKVSSFQSSQYGSPYHYSQYESHAQTLTPLSITYPLNDFQSFVHHNVYNSSSSIPQVEYAPSIALMVNFSHYGSDNLAEVHNPYNVTNNVIDQDVQAMLIFEQSNIMNQLKTEITSDSNIIMYSQYVNESQYATVQNSSFPTQQDDLILYVIEKLKTQVVNCTKINQDNKNVNEILTAELQRYKDQTELSAEQVFWSQNSMNSKEPNLSSRPTIVEVPKELPKVSMVNSSLKKLKFHLASFDVNYKQLYDSTKSSRARSKEQCDDLIKQVNIKSAENSNLNASLQEKALLEPKLYDGSVIQKTNAIVIRDSEETLMLEDESRSKMLQKQKDPMMSEKKVNTKPVDYAALNQLSQDFETRFVPQTELSAEQVFWSQNSMNSKEPNLSSRPTIVEVPKELPKVSMVNSSLKKLKFHLASFDVVVKERTTATTITEGA